MPSLPTSWSGVDFPSSKGILWLCFHPESLHYRIAWGLPAKSEKINGDDLCLLNVLGLVKYQVSRRKNHLLGVI